MKNLGTILLALVFSMPALANDWNCKLEVAKDDIGTLRNDYFPEEKEVAVKMGETHNLSGTTFSFSGDDAQIDVAVVFPGGYNSSITLKPKNLSNISLFANGLTYHPLEDEAYELCKAEAANGKCDDAMRVFFHETLKRLSGQSEGLFTNNAKVTCQRKL